MQISIEDFKRLIRHMNEDAPNPKAQETLSRGRRILRLMMKASESVSTQPTKNGTNDKGEK